MEVNQSCSTPHLFNLPTSFSWILSSIFWSSTGQLLPTGGKLVIKIRRDTKISHLCLIYQRRMPRYVLLLGNYTSANNHRILSPIDSHYPVSSSVMLVDHKRVSCSPSSILQQLIQQAHMVVLELKRPRPFSRMTFHCRPLWTIWWSKFPYSLWKSLFTNTIFRLAVSGTN